MSNSRFPFNFDGFFSVAVPAVTGLVLERHGWPLPEIIIVVASVNLALILAVAIGEAGWDES